MDYRFPNDPASAASKPHPHITLVFRNKDTTSEGLHVLNQGPKIKRPERSLLTPGISISVRKWAGENPEHEAFTWCRADSAAAAMVACGRSDNTRTTESDSARLFSADGDACNPAQYGQSVQLHLSPSPPSPTPPLRSFWPAPQSQERPRCQPPKHRKSHYRMSRL